MKSGVSEAQKTWERVSELLDRHATKWLGMYRDACEATHIRGEQSEDVLDLRMACLNDNLDSARALTQLLSGGDPRVVEHAVEAAGSLEDFGRCADVQQLRAGVQPPKDPMIRAEVAELRRRLKDANALFDAGRYPEAEFATDVILRRADALGYLPLRAEALVLNGDALGAARMDGGIAMLEAAIVAGESSGHDRVVARAATELVYLYRVTDWQLAERSAALAAAALHRIGGDAHLESWLANNRATLRDYQGRFDEAKVELERAIAIKKGLLGPEHLDVAVSLDNLSVALVSLGNLDEALKASDRALEIERHWVPADSTIWASLLQNRADVLRRLGRLDEAENAFQSSKRIFENSPTTSRRLDVASCVVGLGLVAIVRGNLGDAVTYFERALRMQSDDSPFRIAATQFQVATALDRSHRDPERALQLARKALTAYASQPMFDKKRREVQTFLDERRFVAGTSYP